MAKNANIRFENANVAYVSVDTDTHELTGGVMDETTGIFYPVGGGGSGVDNPILTIEVDTTDYTEEPGTLNLLSLKDGSVWEEWASIPGESTSTFEIFVPKYGDEGDNYYEWTGARELTFAINTAYAVSDTVNCTYELDMDNHNFIFSITDGSQPASAKITVTPTI
ncbi:MAG: hypothetical protein IKL32_00015 [Alphaproteobacteria bacterium]|nr:hypothetical protein [Alphaproteobacteria bacterium]MBR6674296.1 hypothetical protein [Alphaproteobacteria bacterium]